MLSQKLNEEQEARERLLQEKLQQEKQLLEQEA